MQVYDLYQSLLLQSGQVDDWAVVEHWNIDTVVSLSSLDVNAGSDRVALYCLWEIDDAPRLPDLVKLHDIADLAATRVRLGEPVLSHCAAGFNRSSLLSGVVLFKLGVARGQALVDYIRAHRPGALGNDTFAAYLASLT